MGCHIPRTGTVVTARRGGRHPGGDPGRAAPVSHVQYRQAHLVSPRSHRICWCLRSSGPQSPRRSGRTPTPAWDLTADIDLQGWSFQLSLDAIGRSGPDEHGNFEWTLAGDLFTIGLRASGFTQYLRQAPIHSPRQRLSVDERGGLSFGQRGYAR